MELSPRKRAVLSAVTKTYILTGEPVGSKTLGTVLENAPSSATLRSEMNELCSLGLLSQPHTSAGRIPTSHGFKLYVNSLMPINGALESDRRFIDEQLEESHAAPEKLHESAGKLLSALTGFPVVTCYDAKNVPTVRKAELVPIGRRAVMLLLIASDGRTASRVVRTDTTLDGELRRQFAEIVKSKIKGKQLIELTLPFMQSILISAEAQVLEFMPLFAALLEMAEEMSRSSVKLFGETALYGVSGSEAAAQKIISLVTLREPMLSLLDGVDGKVGVIFGSDIGFKELEKDSIIAARYGTPQGGSGIVAIIGPDRMAYDRLIPCVEYTAKKLTELINAAQKDMEE